MRVLRCYFELKENDVMLSVHPHVFHYNKHKLKVRNLKTQGHLDELITP